MRAASSLSRPITRAFILFGVVLSLFFAVLAALVVEGIEVHLVDERLAEVEKWARPRAAAGLPADLPAGLRFHRGDDIPLSLRGLPAGVSEAEIDGIGLHVLAGSDEAGPYVVVDHESDYEQIEVLVYSMFAAFFAGFVILALFLGRFVGMRIVTPIRELADAVGQGALALPHTAREDELGILARALDAHTSELRAFLDRERFFTGDVSHELRTPLTVIMGAAEILVENNENPVVRAPARRIYRAAQEATECVTVLLLLARTPELGLFPPVSVGDIARTETDRYQHMVADKPVVLRCTGSASIDVRAPAELCVSAIANLIRNACQYTERGQVTVVLEPGRVSVEDTGPGLPDAVRQTLDRDAAAIPSSGSAGTGLGLSLVKRICEYLGATLIHEQREGGGSRLTIVFPGDFTQS
ncbi:sensor histidine kinase [Massilia arenae]|uniref:histidine kinase n=1 Tax=Massilia arenae TaxID=2603288 RepID=A0A5C7FSW4_9BURK|nr:HAMP domain-containing sensor histidine kinase [Massilia arenae]TXF98153.1 HAMP domain-containing protein [Massilia arenae]